MVGQTGTAGASFMALFKRPFEGAMTRSANLADINYHWPLILEGQPHCGGQSRGIQGA